LIIISLVLIDRKIWSSKEVQDKIKLPILALIPHIVIGKENNGFKNNETIDPKLVTSDYAPTLAGETFRKLRTLIDMRLGNESKILIVGSLFPNEGKSLIASNLAIAFAQQKKKTILIDCDLRRGVQHSTFAKNKTPGFTNIIIKRDKIDTNNITDYIQDTHIPNLFLLTSGDPIPNPSESLGSPQMEKIIQILEKKFDRIIFDSPPFGLSPDLMVMARYTRNILLTLRAGATNLSQFKSTLDEFGDIKKSIFGLVINGSDEVIKGRKYQYSYYQY
jgi:capsular exopolysaccharide synthesis family protein